jgi:hypothetical protein
MAPRQELDDCHRLSQTLRSENANLKDQVLVLRTQNQDLSERAVDDARRLTQLESSNQRLETSVQAYQDERTRLEAAYQELRACLPGPLQPLSARQQSGGKPSRYRSDIGLESTVEPRFMSENDPGIRQADGSAARPAADTRSPSGNSDRMNRSWLPSRTDSATRDQGPASLKDQAPSP